MFTGIQFDIINGYARIIDKTNIKQVFPIVYKTNNLTIYEFINEEKSNKNFYIVEIKKSYTREINTNYISYTELMKNYTQDKNQVKELLDYIKKNDIKCGLSIKPATKVEEIYEFLPYLSLFLVMTVEPGKGGQKLIPETLDKISKLKEYIYQNNLETYIEADGGIKLENADKLKDAGVDIMVVGSGIINSDDYKKTIKELKK